jgi:hypothetical protein
MRHFKKNLFTKLFFIQLYVNQVTFLYKTTILLKKKVKIEDVRGIEIKKK